MAFFKLRTLEAAPYSLGSRSMLALCFAQFCSALADNAVLIVAIALLKTLGQADHASWLQGVFVIPFIVLAPWVGAWADQHPKSRVMLLANLLKLGGTALMAAGFPALLGYGLIGVGAAAYSPAKYGILGQLFAPRDLVRANGIIEGSTIVAILLGVVVGGYLADHSLFWAYAAVMGCYGLATLANLMIPVLHSPATAPLRFKQRLQDFFKTTRLLWRDPASRFSLSGTSLFWGSGATLRILLFAWVPVALHINDNQTPALLMGMVSLGIIVGAVLAGWLIDLQRLNRALWGGLLLGPLIIALAFVTDRWAAMALMSAIGLCGGAFIVPLNALLQLRGQALCGAGQALAVQNLGENLMMLLMVSAAGLAAANHIGATPTVAAFGALLSLTLLWVAKLRPAVIPSIPASRQETS